jgi:protein-glutamine gamma-glutamyltransferase
MNTPPFLMLSALGLWGWQADWLLLGLALGATLEASRMIRVRWDIDPDDFRRLWNATALLALGAASYFFLARADWETAARFIRDPATGEGMETLRGAARAGLLFVLWLPMVFYPFLLVHTYSRADWLPWSTISPYARWRERRATGDLRAVRRSRGMHPTYPYLVLALLVGMASDRQGPVYFPTLGLLAVWALWSQRSPRFRLATWCGTVAAVWIIAFGGVESFRWAFERYEQWETQWLSRLSADRFNPQGTRTDIGAISRRKLSGRILLRVQTGEQPPPGLLREAAFNQYRASYWTATRRDFYPVAPHLDDTTWSIAPASVPSESVSISRYTRKGETLLALPAGAFEVRDLPAAAFETNRFTVARVSGAARVAAYTVRHGPGPGADARPDAEDLDLDHVSSADRAAILTVAQDLGLSQLDPRTALERVRDFLLGDFEYSLDATGPETGSPQRAGALEHFLFESRRGHCEYFATVTALLLRAREMPTRYVVGYAVQERKGNQFVVRARHAHAWCLVFLDEQWETVDNTPGGWIEREASLARWWEPIQDHISQAWFHFTHWRERDTRWRFYVLVAATAILLFMAARELRGSRWRRITRAARRGHREPAQPGSDSEFYAVEQFLARHWLPRPAAQPVTVWIARMPLPSDDWTFQLRRAVRLHYRLRFDPAGLTPEQRSELRTLASGLVKGKGSALFTRKAAGD